MMACRIRSPAAVIIATWAAKLAAARPADGAMPLNCTAVELIPAAAPASRHASGATPAAGDAALLAAAVAAADAEVAEAVPEDQQHELRRCCNGSQAEAAIAAASRRLTLIHGPPGTGKVHIPSSTDCSFTQSGRICLAYALNDGMSTGCNVLPNKENRGFSAILNVDFGVCTDTHHCAALAAAGVAAVAHEEFRR